MPALPERLPSRDSGAGVRKPPKKETESRKGAYHPKRSRTLHRSNVGKTAAQSALGRSSLSPPT